MLAAIFPLLPFGEKAGGGVTDFSRSTTESIYHQSRARDLVTLPAKEQSSTRWAEYFYTFQYFFSAVVLKLNYVVLTYYGIRSPTASDTSAAGRSRTCSCSSSHNYCVAVCKFCAAGPTHQLLYSAHAAAADEIYGPSGPSPGILIPPWEKEEEENSAKRASCEMRNPRISAREKRPHRQQ